MNNVRYRRGAYPGTLISMRTLFIPPFFLAIYSVVMLSVAWLVSPGPAHLSERHATCIAAVEVGFPCVLWRHQSPNEDAVLDGLEDERPSERDSSRAAHGVPDGVVTLTAISQALAVGCRRSCRRCRVPPLVKSFTTKLAKRVSGDQMALCVEDVVDGGMG